VDATDGEGEVVAPALVEQPTNRAAIAAMDGLL
jgi:hypothetical protein